MKKLRLLLTKACNKNCEGCCNKDWDLDNLPICRSYKEYDEIMITGGEPTLFSIKLEHLIKDIRLVNKSAKIFLYTTQIKRASKFDLDGITLTLHTYEDVLAFEHFEQFHKNFKIPFLRLNVFRGIPVPPHYNNWIVKKDIEWIKNCPLPKDEVFMRIAG